MGCDFSGDPRYLFSAIGEIIDGYLSIFSFVSLISDIKIEVYFLDDLGIQFQANQ